MKKFFLSLAVFVMALCANAQTNQYFWYNGNLMMGNPIAQIDSVTFGEGEPADTLHIMLPRTIIKTVHDTVYITIHDTVCPEPSYMGHQYVDLGLPSGVLWATCNIGADSPEQNGDYFAWGEITPKTSYTWENYSYYNGWWSCTKYNETDGKIQLDSQDDAAVQIWGGFWRIPTLDELNELLQLCIWNRDTINDVTGYSIKGPNNNTIFLPDSGCKDYTHMHGAGTLGNYWGSTLCLEDSNNAANIGFNTNIHEIDYSRRMDGHTIRPVVSKTVVEPAQ